MVGLRPALVSVSFGELVEPVGRLHEAGILTATQVGSLADLVAAEAAGVDVVVARGGEGGGHGRNDLATLPLLQLVLERTDRPVYAAGGILNHRGLAAVLAAGAAGAWVGTAFLGCVEAESAPAARAALFEAQRDRLRPGLRRRPGGALAAGVRRPCRRQRLLRRLGRP